MTVHSTSSSAGILTRLYNGVVTSKVAWALAPGLGGAALLAAGIKPIYVMGVLGATVAYTWLSHLKMRASKPLLSAYHLLMSGAALGAITAVIGGEYVAFSNMPQIASNFMQVGMVTSLTAFTSLYGASRALAAYPGQMLKTLLKTFAAASAGAALCFGASIYAAPKLGTPQQPSQHMVLNHG